MRCKSHGIIPKGLLVNTPYSSRRSSKIDQLASMALLTDRIHFHWNNMVSQLQKIQQLENFLRSSVSSLDQQCIFTAVESSFRNVFNKQKGIHIRKFSMLKNQHDKVRSTPGPISKNWALISQNMSLQTVKSHPMKGLNFAIANPHTNLDMICAVESLGMEF
jgi:hypothetical protein